MHVYSQFMKKKTRSKVPLSYTLQWLKDYRSKQSTQKSNIVKNRRKIYQKIHQKFVNKFAKKIRRQICQKYSAKSSAKKFIKNISLSTCCLSLMGGIILILTTSSRNCKIIHICLEDAYSLKQDY